MLGKLRKVLLILDLKRHLGADAILNVSIAAKVRVRCIARPVANQLRLSRETAPLCARSRKPPLSLAQLKSIGSLTSSPASSHYLFPFGLPPARLFSNKLHPILSFKNRIFSPPNCTSWNKPHSNHLRAGIVLF